MSDNVYKIITDKFIEQLNKGVVPWRKPWACRDLPMNLVSKKPYNGVNVLLLLMSGFSSPYWLSFKQVQAKGGKVRKGEKGTIISYFKVMKDKKDPNKTYPLFRYYRVWNVEQCDGIEVPQSDTVEFVENANAEAVSSRWTDCPEVRHGGDSAHYLPVQDYIQMPSRDSFKTPEHYYSILFHEQIHATGHKSRLDRLVVGCFTKNSKTYAFEELVAELGSSFLRHDAGIDASALFDNSAAYIASWLKALQNDPKLIVKAATHAQKAVEYMRGEYKPNSEKSEKQSVLETVS